MYQPEQYSRINQPPRDATAVALGKYGHMINWREDNMDTVMDLGCGPGQVLMDLIMPKIKGKFSKIYGADLSEKMIEFCKQKYPDVDVKFLVFDILEGDNDFVRNYGQVDHVLSTFAIHWFPDQPKAFRNICNLLKPGGDLFSIHLLFGKYFDILKHMDQNKKWCSYFDNLKQFVPSTHESEQPEKDLRNVLESSGFKEIFIKVHEQEVPMETEEKLMAFLSGVIPQIERVPEARRSEYVKDFFYYGVSKDVIHLGLAGEASISVNLVTLYARKPK